MDRAGAVFGFHDERCLAVGIVHRAKEILAVPHGKHHPFDAVVAAYRSVKWQRTARLLLSTRLP